MSDTSSLVLNRFFSRNTFKTLLNDEDSQTYSAVMRRYVENCEHKSNRQLISEVYSILDRNHRNEYYYKNSLLNKLLLGVHSINTTSALSEIPIAKSKADFILINGKAVVYEIKTALDNFDRLDSQINDYYKAFTRVSVITCEEHFTSLNKILDASNVGICVLTKRGTISEKKKPVEDDRRLDYSVMFRILRKSEYESIILDAYGALPEVKQYQYFRRCFEMFSALPIRQAYSSFTRQLKLRTSIDVIMYEKVPFELKAIAYFSEFKSKDFTGLEMFLNREYG